MTVKDIKETNTLRGVMFMNSMNHDTYCNHVKGILDNPPACGLFPKLFFFLATLFKKINLDGAV